MSEERVPVTIKKYANRRLYNTDSSAYVTLEDLAAMVKRGSDFVVTDAKNGEDITRSVLAQIIFEQEGKHGQSLLPITFLRQLIRFYGTGMQMLVPSFLDMSLANLAKEGGAFGQMLGGGGFGGNSFAGKTFASGALTSAAQPMLDKLEEQTRRNMAMFQQAMTMFTPFPPEAAPGPGAKQADPRGAGAAPPAVEPAGAGVGQARHESQASPDHQASHEGQESHASEVEQMRRQLQDMQRRLETLAGRTD